MVFAMGTTKEHEAGGSLTDNGAATVASPDTASKLSSRDAGAPVAYFGVALGAGMIPCDDDELPLVFVDRTLALRCVKKYRGARFKAFGSREEAAAFSVTPAVTVVESTDVPDSTTAALIGEKSSNYRAPKSQDLVQLRKAIEAGDATFFKQSVWSNPRYLVGSGDTPTILQEGYRYNALHVACAKRQPALVQLLLDTLQDPHFLELLYPDDNLDVRNRRKAFLLDLYLNTPDKGRCETPLHFACKFGCYEAVELLVALPECDRNRCNKEGQTPREIICDRLPSASADLKKRMDSLFEERLFVPVLRSEDNSVAPTVGEPFSPNASTMHSPVTSPRDTSLSIMATAGPMSPTEARSMYRQWKTPKRRSIGLKEPLSPMDSMRLADMEKGLERIGRGLAKEMRVPWNEYWPFLGCWCNLASPEGLEKLEAHLRSKRSQVVSERWSLENSPAAPDKLSLSSPINQLCEALGDLKLGPSFEKSWGRRRQESQNHLHNAKTSRTPNGRAVSAAEPGCTPPQCGASHKGVPPAAQRLARVLFDWAVAHDTGPQPEADLTLQLNEQILPELARLERPGGPELWRLHSWLGREVHLLLRDSLEPSERQSLGRALHTQLPPLSANRAAPASPPSTDDEDDGGSVGDVTRRYRQPSGRRRSRTLKWHLQCVLRSLCALLETDSANAEPFHCQCSQGTTGSRETAFLRDCKAQPVEEEEEEEDEVFFTPPTSPCSSSGSSSEAHTPDEGPLFFIQGSRPSKVDLDVLRALEPSLLEPEAFDPLTYPCVHQWMQVIRSFPVEATSRWPSPTVANLRRSVRTVSSPDSPCASGDSKSDGCRTPQRELLSTQLRPKVLWSASPGYP